MTNIFVVKYGLFYEHLVRGSFNISYYRTNMGTLFFHTSILTNEYKHCVPHIEKGTSVHKHAFLIMSFGGQILRTKSNIYIGILDEIE